MRRTTAWLTVIALAGIAVACDGTYAPCPQAPKSLVPEIRRCVPPRQRVIDLSHVLVEGYRLPKLEMGENAGTHVDAPAQLVEGQRSIDQLRLDELVVPAAVIDVRAKVAANPDYLVNASDVVDWEAIHGPVPVGALVIANTGWHARFADPQRYVNQDAAGVMHFPGFGADAARLLVERDVAGIGIDTLSIDNGPSQQHEAHKIVLAAGKYQIENLANLDELPELGATVFVGVLPVVDGTQAPARILALIPEVDEGEESEGEERR